MRQGSLFLSLIFTVLIAFPLFSETMEIHERRPVVCTPSQKKHPHYRDIDSLSKQIAADSTNHNVINQRGECWLKLEKHKKALDDFQWAIKLETFNPQYNKNRGDAYVGLRDEIRAMDSYNRAIRSDKESLLGYQGKFALLIRQKKFEKAKKILDKMYATAPKNPTLYVCEAKWLAKTGDQDNSYIMYKKGVTLLPNYIDGRLQLATHYINSGESQKAYAHIESVLKSDPTHVEALKIRSLAHSELSKFDRALEDCNTLLAFDSTNPSHWTNRGRCYMLFGQFHEGRSDLKKAISLDSTHLETLLLQAEYFRYDKRYSEAIRCYNTLIEMFPKEDSLYFHRAQCRHDLGDFFNASKDYSKAISLNKKSELYYNNSAANYSHMGWQKDAIQQYRIVLHMNPDAVYAYCNIGTAFFHVGKYEEAEENLKKFLRLVDTETEMKFVDLAQTIMAKIEKKKLERGKK